MQAVILIFMEKSSREILSENNISITNPRLLVLEKLLKTKKPTTIENLQKELQDEVAVSTLYRVLNDLKSIEIVNEFTNPEDFSSLFVSDEIYCSKLTLSSMSTTFPHNVQNR